MNIGVEESKAGSTNREEYPWESVLTMTRTRKPAVIQETIHEHYSNDKQVEKTKAG
jgi:hypothetical protein